MDNERDLISQCALLKHRQAVVIGGKLMEVIPIEAVMSAELTLPKLFGGQTTEGRYHNRYPKGQL